MFNKVWLSGFMPKWIRKVKHDVSTFRVSVPASIVQELGWESCSYVTVESGGDGCIIIRRLPGDGTRNNDSAERPDGSDRSSV
jgi:hypothetical protein